MNSMSTLSVTHMLPKIRLSLHDHLKSAFFRQPNADIHKVMIKKSDGKSRAAMDYP